MILTNLPALLITEDLATFHKRKCHRRKGYIYFAANEQRTLIKIGFALYPRVRLSWINSFGARMEEVGSGWAFIGILEGSMAEESYIHRKFAAHRYKGKGWESSLDWFDYATLFPLIGGFNLKSINDVAPLKRPRSA